MALLKWHVFCDNNIIVVFNFFCHKKGCNDIMKDNYKKFKYWRNYLL